MTVKDDPSSSSCLTDWLRLLLPDSSVHKLILTGLSTHPCPKSAVRTAWSPAGKGSCRQQEHTSSSWELTKHFAYIGLNVHILQVLVGVRVVEAQGGVQADGHPHPVPHPRQLPHLALPPWVGIKGLLWNIGVQIRRWNKGKNKKGFSVTLTQSELAILGQARPSDLQDHRQCLAQLQTPHDALKLLIPFPKCDLKAVISYSVFIYTTHPSLLQLLSPLSPGAFLVWDPAATAQGTCAQKVSFFLVPSWPTLTNKPTCAKYTLSTKNPIHFTFIWTSFQFSHTCIYSLLHKNRLLLGDKYFQKSWAVTLKGLAHVSGQSAGAEALILLKACRNLSHFLPLRWQIKHCR